MKFSQTYWKSFGEIAEFFTQGKFRARNLHFWNVNCIDNNINANTWRKMEHFHKMSEIKYKKWFFEKIFFHKNFLWTCRMQLLQPRQKFLLKLQKILTHSPNRSMIWLFYKKLSGRKCSSEHKKCSFLKPVEKFLVKMQNFSLKTQKNKELIFLSEKIYTHIVPLES